MNVGEVRMPVTNRHVPVAVLVRNITGPGAVVRMLVVFVMQVPVRMFQRVAGMRVVVAFCLRKEPKGQSSLQRWRSCPRRFGDRRSP